jgi:uncharacterized protein YceK
MGRLKNSRERKHLRSKMVFSLVAVILGGCTSIPTHVASAPPPDYRQLVADSGLAMTLRKKPSFGALEISELKKAVLGEPGDWRACIRTVDAGKPAISGCFLRLILP